MGLGRGMRWRKGGHCGGGRERTFSGAARCHPDHQRPRTQPQKPVGQHSARQVQRGHGRVGLGKSTLAFDILFNEGQRRYLESLNAYARSIVQPAGWPEVDAVYGIPPTVAIEQRLSRGGRKEHRRHHHRGLALSAAAVREAGHQHCVHDGAEVRRRRPTASPRSC